MRFYELIETASAGASSAGSVAVLSQPLGTVSRNGGSLLSGIQTSDPTPNTPKEYKSLKKKKK